MMVAAKDTVSIFSVKLRDTTPLTEKIARAANPAC
jgi:hypothetical protein